MARSPKIDKLSAEYPEVEFRDYINILQPPDPHTIRKVAYGIQVHASETEEMSVGEVVAQSIFLELFHDDPASYSGDQYLIRIFSPADICGDYRIDLDHSVDVSVEDITTAHDLKRLT